MEQNCRLNNPSVLMFRLSDFDRERLLRHAHILRERAKGHPGEAHALLQVARCFDEMLQEDCIEQSDDTEMAIA